MATLKKWKPSDVQKHKLRTSYNESLSVLNELKRQSLGGDALEDMKTLETAVQHLEVLLLR